MKHRKFSRRHARVTTALAGIAAVAALATGCVSPINSPTAQSGATAILSAGGRLAQPTASVDGSVVAFITTAGNLGYQDPNPARADIVIWDRTTGEKTYVAPSAATEGVLDNPETQGRVHDSFSLPTTEMLSLSGDGRYLAFVTRESLVAADTDTEFDAYEYDRNDASMRFLTPHYTSPLQFNMISLEVAESSDGSVVTLFPRFFPPQFAVEQFDRSTGVVTTQLALPIAAEFSGFDASPNGRYVAITTTSPLVPEDVDTTQDMYMLDTLTDEVTYQVTPELFYYAGMWGPLALDDGGFVVNSGGPTGPNHDQFILVRNPGKADRYLTVPTGNGDPVVGGGAYLNSGGFAVDADATGDRVTIGVVEFVPVWNPPLPVTTLSEWNTETNAVRPIANNVPSAGLTRITDTNSIIFPMINALFQWNPST